jgi:hypothetical protein
LAVNELIDNFDFESDLSELRITELPVYSICQTMMFDMQIIEHWTSWAYPHAKYWIIKVYASIIHIIYSCSFWLYYHSNSMSKIK